MYTVYCANQPNSMLKLEECKKNEKFLDTLKVINKKILNLLFILLDL